MQKVSLLFLPTLCGKVLSITRKDNKKDWGLPGSKLEYGENHWQALAREVIEETGIDLNKENLPTYGSVYETYKGNEICCTIFKPIEVNRFQPINNEGSLVKFIYMMDLKVRKNSFWEYNTGIIEAYRRYSK